MVALEQQRCDETTQQLVDEQQLTQQLQRQLAALKSQMAELSEVQEGLEAEQAEKQGLAQQVRQPDGWVGQLVGWLDGLMPVLLAGSLLAACTLIAMLAARGAGGQLTGLRRRLRCR